MWQQRDTPIEGRVVCGVVARGMLNPFPQQEEGKNGRCRTKFENIRRENDYVRAFSSVYKHTNICMCMLSLACTNRN